MASRFVFVNQSLGDCAVDDGHGGRVRGLGVFGVAFLDCGQNFLDGRTECRALAGVALSARFSLTGALACLR